MTQEQIYNKLRETFNSQSGAYLNKQDAMDIAVQIKNRLLNYEMNSKSVNFRREDHPASAEKVHRSGKKI